MFVLIRFPKDPKFQPPNMGFLGFGFRVRGWGLGFRRYIRSFGTRRQEEIEKEAAVHSKRHEAEGLGFFQDSG